MLRALYQLINLAIHLYILIVLARVLLSWIHPDPRHPVVRFLCQATDPVLDRISRVLPLRFSGVDFSPIFLLIILSFLQRLIRLQLH